MTVTLKGTKNLKKEETNSVIPLHVAILQLGLLCLRRQKFTLWFQNIFFRVWEKPECINLTNQREFLFCIVHWLLYDFLKILFVSIYVYACSCMFKYMCSYMYVEYVEVWDQLWLLFHRHNSLCVFQPGSSTGSQGPALAGSLPSRLGCLASESWKPTSLFLHIRIPSTWLAKCTVVQPNPNGYIFKMLPHLRLRKHCERVDRKNIIWEVYRNLLEDLISFFIIRSYTYKISATWLHRWPWVKPMNMPNWMWVAQESLALHKEQQADKESWVGEVVLPREHHTNCLSSAKWSALKTYIQATSYGLCSNN
jgi:hypothetical protein